MGNCCNSEEDQKQTMTLKPNTNKTKKTQFRGAGAAPNTFLEDKETIKDYYSDQVKAKIKEIGEFKYEDKTSDETKIQFFPMKLVDNSVRLMCRYEGEWTEEDSKRHGKGIQVWPDGSVYEGYWKHDKASGRGRLIHENGDVYVGDFKNDEANGYGVFIKSSGKTNKSKSAKNKQISNSDEKQADDDNEANNKSKMMIPGDNLEGFDGYKYEGKWKDDRQHGEGKEVWPDGSSFQGKYIKGKKDGQGEFNWPDGSNYVGEFKNNHIEGYGTYKWSDGRIYEGLWKADKMHGRGTYKWPDGRKFEGNYENDRKEGHGVYTWPDGRVYDGQWHAGKQHGEGVYTKLIIEYKYQAY